MSEEEYRNIFVKKLNYYMELKGVNQSDLMRDLGLSSSTVSNWCTGLKLPRMNKIQRLADYFGIQKSDLLEDKPSYPVFTTSDSEREHLIKYRSLDASGKETVDTILDLQYKRVMDSKVIPLHEDPAPYHTIAAHIKDNASTDDIEDDIKNMTKWVEGQKKGPK